MNIAPKYTISNQKKKKEKSNQKWKIVNLNNRQNGFAEMSSKIDIEYSQIRNF